jgi:hypothetical protein
MVSGARHALDFDTAAGLFRIRQNPFATKLAARLGLRMSRKGTWSAGVSEPILPCDASTTCVTDDATLAGLVGAKRM